jgi:hypothetical protein
MQLADVSAKAGLAAAERDGLLRENDKIILHARKVMPRPERHPSHKLLGDVTWTHILLFDVCVQCVKAALTSDTRRSSVRSARTQAKRSGGWRASLRTCRIS